VYVSPAASIDDAHAIMRHLQLAALPVIPGPAPEVAASADAPSSSGSGGSSSSTSNSMQQQSQQQQLRQRCSMTGRSRQQPASLFMLTRQVRD
jgi:ribosomal protein S14